MVLIQEYSKIKTYSVKNVFQADLMYSNRISPNFEKCDGYGVLGHAVGSTKIERNLVSVLK